MNVRKSNVDDAAHITVEFFQFGVIFRSIASGITVVPVDLSEILSAARKIEDADETLQAKMKEIRQYAAVPEQYNDKLILQAKFGVAVEQWMEANEIDAVAIQCWDSLEQNYGCKVGRHS